MHNGEKPNHIKYFERAMLISLAPGVVILALSSQGMGITAVLFQTIVLVILLINILLISRKRSNIAKWVLIVMFFLGLPMYVPLLSILLSAGFVGVLSLLQLTVQLVGVYFLFTHQSRQWFSRTQDVD